MIFTLIPSIHARNNGATFLNVISFPSPFVSFFVHFFFECCIQNMRYHNNNIDTRLYWPTYLFAKPSDFTYRSFSTFHFTFVSNELFIQWARQILKHIKNAIQTVRTRNFIKKHPDLLNVHSFSFTKRRHSNVDMAHKFSQLTWEQVLWSNSRKTDNKRGKSSFNSSLCLVLSYYPSIHALFRIILLKKKSKLVRVCKNLLSFHVFGTLFRSW